MQKKKEKKASGKTNNQMIDCFWLQFFQERERKKDSEVDFSPPSALDVCSGQAGVVSVLQRQTTQQTEAKESNPSSHQLPFHNGGVGVEGKV